MDIKKSDQANLDKHRSTGFLLGLIFAMALLFAAFEYTTRPQSYDEDDSMLDDLAEDLTMKSAPQDTKDMVSAIAAPASKAITQNVKEVAHVDNSDKIAPITSKLVIGSGEAVQREAEVTEALPQVTADKDTAVLRTVEQIPESRRHRAVHEVAHAQPPLSSPGPAAEDSRQGGGLLHCQQGRVHLCPHDRQVGRSHARQ